MRHVYTSTQQQTLSAETNGLPLLQLLPTIPDWRGKQGPEHSQRDACVALACRPCKLCMVVDHLQGSAQQLLGFFRPDAFQCSVLNVL